MSATREASLANRVVAEVTSWPAVNVTRADCGRGIGLSAGSHQIVHLHAPGRVQVRLTRPVIQRMEDALLESGQVHLEERGDWVSVRLDSDSDAALLVSLVSVAIKANAAGPPGVARREGTSCPDHPRHTHWRKH